MAIAPIQLKPKEKRGGGLLGSIVGGLVSGLGTATAAVAAPFSGGTSLAAIPAAIGAGTALGGTIGGQISKGGVKGRESVSPLENAAKMDPGVAIGQLNEAQKLIESDLSLPAAEVDTYRTHFDLARKKLEERMRFS